MLGTDGGPAYRSAEVQRFLREHQILHLVNLPHVPRHNAPAERGIGELKGVLEERGQLHEHAPVPEWQSRLEAAGEHLDGVVPRTSRGFLTAKAYDQILPSWYDLVDRAAFYEAAGTTAATAMGGLESARERRRAERRAKLDTMERFGLIERTRGRASRAQFKAETVS